MEIYFYSIAVSVQFIITPKKEYTIEDKVEHKLFDKGTILAFDGVKNSVQFTINFKGKGSKIIIAKYVKLVKILIIVMNY